MNTTLASLGRRCLPAAATVGAAAAAVGWSTSSRQESSSVSSAEGTSRASSPPSSKNDTPNSTTHARSSNVGRPRLLFLGSGSSTGCPKPLCALAFPDEQQHDESPGRSCSCRDTSGPYSYNNSNNKQNTRISSTITADPTLVALQEQLGDTCRTSKLAAIGDPRKNKDYRNNPSLLIRIATMTTIRRLEPMARKNVPIRNVVIDCGKTFRETAIRWMPQNGIRSLDAIVLTHEHMDAVGGLDDVRGFQRRSPVSGVMESTPVFLSQQCLDAIKRQFFYLVPPDPFKAHDGKVVQNNKDGVKVVRAVASLQYNLIERFQPFVAAGLKMIPLPVMVSRF